MSYADLLSIQATDPGDILTAAWCDQTRDNLEFLVDPPSCSVYDSGTQSVGNGATAVLDADSENYDNDAMHSTSSNTSRLSIQTAGRYLIQARVRFSGDADGFRQIDVITNGGSPQILSSSRPEPSGTLPCYLTGTLSLVLSDGDYIEVRAYQNAGNALDVKLLELAAVFITR